MKPIVWTIAGSDSGGGAGIQADLHTFQNFGVFGCSVITTVTAQNTSQVNDVYVLPEKILRSQMESLLVDLPPLSIKLGLLGNAASIQVLIEFFSHQKLNAKIILDPVMLATSGGSLIDEAYANFKNALIKLFPYCALITPNIPETETLLNIKITNHMDMVNAAKELLNLGAKSVLIKGGHFEDDAFAQDYWTNGEKSFWLSNAKRTAGSFHGSGCTLSSAIAANLALGFSMEDALVRSKMYVTASIAYAFKLGSGAAPVNHTLQNKQELPYLTLRPLKFIPQKFPGFGAPLGIYPVVDSVAWIEKLLPLGIKTIQLRIKKESCDRTTQEESIKNAIALGQTYKARVFINDHWELAIKHKAYGVHLGQEDLLTADVNAIFKAGLRLGVSTHNFHEVAHALSVQPSYIACGPIFPTSHKMVHQPQGLDNLKMWRELLACPIVAIGGIDLENIRNVADIGVEGIAMISAITMAKDFIVATKKFQEIYGSHEPKQRRITALQ